LQDRLLDAVGVIGPGLIDHKLRLQNGTLEVLADE